MTSTWFKITAPTFDAEVEISHVTHTVIAAADVLQWMVGIDRFEVFRIAARQGWEIRQSVHENYEPKQIQLRQTLSEFYSDSHSRINAPRDAREDYEGC